MNNCFTVKEQRQNCNVISFTNVIVREKSVNVVNDNKTK